MAFGKKKSEREKRGIAGRSDSLFAVCFVIESVTAAGTRAVSGGVILIREAEFLEHRHVFFDGGAGSGQHIARDGSRSAGAEGSGTILRQDLAAGCKADVGRWIDEAEEGNRAEHVFCRQLWAAFHLCARDSHEGVDWDGFDAEFLQADGHVETVFPGLAHADDAAGADAEAFCLRHLDGADAVIIGVRGADLREEAAGGLDVVMVAGDTGGEQAVQLFTGEQAMRGTEIDGQFLFHLFIGIDGPVEVLAGERPAGGHDGEAVGAGILIGFGVADDFLFGQEVVLVDVGMMAGSLRTVFAVLTTAADAAIDDGAEVDVLATEVILQAQGTFLELSEWSGEEEGKIIPALDAMTSDDLVREFGDIHKKTSFLIDELESHIVNII